MTFNNALGFLLVSAVMIFTPAVAPTWFPASGFDGTSTRAIWLVLMGLVHGGIGITYLANTYVAPVVLRVAAFRPQTRGAGAMLPNAHGSVI